MSDYKRLKKERQRTQEILHDLCETKGISTRRGGDVAFYDPSVKKQNLSVCVNANRWRKASYSCLRSPRDQRTTILTGTSLGAVRTSLRFELMEAGGICR